MGSCFIYLNTVIAGLIMRQMYEMLLHPVLRALTFMIIKKRIPQQRFGGQNVLSYYCVLCYVLTIAGLGLS